MDTSSPNTLLSCATAALTSRVRHEHRVQLGAVETCPEAGLDVQGVSGLRHHPADLETPDQVPQLRFGVGVCDDEHCEHDWRGGGGEVSRRPSSRGGESYIPADVCSPGALPVYVFFDALSFSSAASALPLASASHRKQEANLVINLFQ